MIRREAVEIVVKSLFSGDIAVSANGFMSRDLYEAYDRPTNFYMIGSMGLASSIGLGLAIKNPKKRINIFDGDGNILMNLGSLVTIGSSRPKNLIHFVFDNNSHESTGGQPTNSDIIKINEIAKVAKYKVFTARTERKLASILKKIKKLNGPIFVLIKIEKGKHVSRRIEMSPKMIKIRFMKAINQK